MLSGFKDLDEVTGGFGEGDLIVVDYIQLLESGKPLIELKKLALELNLPILVLSQVRRTVDYRKSHRPTINDIRLRHREQASYADKILILYREEYYGKANESHVNTAEVMIARNTTGQTLLIRLSTNAEEKALCFHDFS